MIRDYIMSVIGNGSITVPNVYGKLTAITVSTGTSGTRAVSFSVGAGTGAELTLGPHTLGAGSAQYRPRLPAVDASLGTPLTGQYAEIFASGKFTLTVTGAAPGEVTTATVYVEV